ncbi:MAG: GntR family transcriptional regulator [Actinobacteria bacterium]|nr:GntR family transcriptional regulator [Actinomycetota bacterium]
MVALLDGSPLLIYLYHITPPSLSERAYAEIRRMIVRLELAPGTVIREESLRAALGLGRTPIREALQRLARDQFVSVIPRRGVYVSSIDIGDLALLYETRSILEPYAMRLACARGDARQWDEMATTLNSATTDSTPDQLLAIDRHCRELVWSAADNRFLTDQLDMLYAHSDRLWHLYVADVADLHDLIKEHYTILDALRAGDAQRAAELIETHMRRFDEQIQLAVHRRRQSPIAD